jgi:hypothetical protein
MAWGSCFGFERANPVSPVVAHVGTCRVGTGWVALSDVNEKTPARRERGALASNAKALTVECELAAFDFFEPGFGSLAEFPKNG